MSGDDDGDDDDDGGGGEEEEEGEVEEASCTERVMSCPPRCLALK